MPQLALDAEMGTEKCRTELGDQLFRRIGMASEAIVEIATKP